MLVYKDGDDKKDILGFQCDLCNHVTMMDVIPNKHGEFRYICPKCGHHMTEMDEAATENKEEENRMVNTYTVTNAAKRLNCSTATINRAIQDGRFHDCFMEAGYNGRPAWMIPSDQVEEWVTRGGFTRMGKKNEQFLTQKQVNEKLCAAKESRQNKPRMVFDPEAGKEVEVLDLLHDDGVKKDILDEFKNRAVRRVAKDKTCQKEPEKANDLLKPGEVVVKRDANGKAIVGRYPFGFAYKTDGEKIDLVPNPTPANYVVRTEKGFSITIPDEMVNSLITDEIVQQMKSTFAEAIDKFRASLDEMNEQLKKLEEVLK